MTNTTDIAWLPGLFDLGYRLVFAHGLAPEEMLRRMECDMDAAVTMTLREADDLQARLPSGKSVVRCGVHQEWGYALEEFGVHGANPRVVENLSEETRALELLRTADGTSSFMFAAHGEIVTSFDLAAPEASSGSDPGRLAPWINRIMEGNEAGGLSDSETMLVLARDAFDARVPREPVEKGRLLAAIVG